MREVEGGESWSSRRGLGENQPLILSNFNAHQGALKCPRCDSLNTKFCYYNNYNLSQPRHFCKSCRRYWTNGGVLRNVPVGGGCRKAKRSSKSKVTQRTSPPSSQSTTVESTAPLQLPSASLLNDLSSIMAPSTITSDASSNFDYFGLPSSQNLWGHNRLDQDWQGGCKNVDPSIFDLPSISAGDHSYWGSTTVTGSDHQELQNNLCFP